MTDSLGLISSPLAMARASILELGVRVHTLSGFFSMTRRNSKNGCCADRDMYWKDCSRSPSQGRNTDIA